MNDVVGQVVTVGVVTVEEDLVEERVYRQMTLRSSESGLKGLMEGDHVSGSLYRNRYRESGGLR